MARSSRASDFTPHLTAAPPKRKPFATNPTDANLTMVTSATPADGDKAQIVVAASSRGEQDCADLLAALGLSTRQGVVFCRFREGQVRLFVDPDGEVSCQWCKLACPDFRSRVLADVLAHVRQHRYHGHRVSDGVEERVREYFKAGGA